MLVNEMLIKALHSYDKSRERSQQKEIGVSQVGGCRRAVWFQLNNEPKVNETIKLPALMGTAIHKLIEEALVAEAEANWSDYMLEKEIEYNGLKGHVDLFIPSAGAVIDWKTTKLKNLEYFPSKQQRWQVQLYGYLLENNGYEVKTVTLVGIPRDGDERHVRIHSEEYNREIAEEGIAWLKGVREATMPPAPERYASQFCLLYCPYYGDSCGGKGKELPVEVIEDTQTISAAERYLEISQEIKKLEAEKDATKAALENVNGVTPSGITISWSEIKGRRTLDEEYVAYFFEKHQEEIKYKTASNSMRLTVKE